MSETTEIQPVVMDATEADTTAKRYCCAGCWGPLTVWYLGKQQSRIGCSRCGDGRGFVTKRYAERRRQESVVEAVEVKQVLRTISVVNKCSTADVLKDLGV